jgi:hypothetical protein
MRTSLQGGIWGRRLALGWIVVGGDRKSAGWRREEMEAAVLTVEVRLGKPLKLNRSSFGEEPWN